MTYVLCYMTYMLYNLCGPYVRKAGILGVDHWVGEFCLSIGLSLSLSAFKLNENLNICIIGQVDNTAMVWLYGGKFWVRRIT